MTKLGCLFHFVFAGPLAFLSLNSFATTQTELHQDWQIQDSAVAGLDGASISTARYKTLNWISASIPSTVLGAMLDQQLFTDPFLGKNFRNLPGTLFPEGINYQSHEMDAASPFAHGWWFRKSFNLPSMKADEIAELHFEGIDYSATVWINGEQVADADAVVGSYRSYHFVIPHPQQVNTVALLIRGQTPQSLAASWVDWNPMPQDKNLGINKSVTLFVHGEASIASPQVITHLESPAEANQPAMTNLTIETEVTNHTHHAMSSELKGKLGDEAFSESITLEPHETRLVAIHLQKRVRALWWPAQMGTPRLETLRLHFLGEKLVRKVGLREVTSELTAEGSRLFKVNGLPIQIRGGGWASEMFLRYSIDRIKKEFALARDLNLNTLRLEGQMQPESFYSLADEMGILLMPGWVCCSLWEKPEAWTETTFKIARESLRDQIRILRAHPSVFVFLYGSDKSPPLKIEEMYLSVLSQEHWHNPTLASAAENTAKNGPTGVKMTGPYDYVPPSYWFVDHDKFGGGWGFNTETSAGAAVPPLESLKNFIPKDHLWPIDDHWNHHAGEVTFKDFHLFIDGQRARYGESSTVEEFTKKAQVMAYDNERAMFEAYGKNKYHSATGVVQWMLNNAWPSVIWHLYDYYLRTGGGYFGAKKALEPIHIQYSLDDRTIVAVNSTYQPVAGVVAQSTVYDFSLNPVYQHLSPSVDLSADQAQVLDTIPELSLPSQTYFIKLRLTNVAGQELSNNFYWLSTQKESYDWEHSTFYHTPTTQEGDLRELNSLQTTQLSVTTTPDSSPKPDSKGLVHVTVKNIGKALAFSVHLSLRSTQTGDEYLPSFWSDNYFSLLPGEQRELTVQASGLDAATMEPNILNKNYRILAEGWNVGLN